MNSTAKLSPLLVEAKDQYIRQLSEIMAPFVVHSINGAYQHAKKNAKRGQVVVEFQRKLRDVQRWNSTTIDQQVRAISRKYPFVQDLIAACFVSYVKILSSVKIHAAQPNIRLKLPSDDVFIHRVFTLAAKEFYMKPTLVQADRAERMEAVRLAVENSVRELLPISDILRAYLGNTVDADGVDPNELDDDDSDSDSADRRPDVVQPPIAPHAPVPHAPVPHAPVPHDAPVPHAPVPQSPHVIQIPIQSPPAPTDAKTHAAPTDAKTDAKAHADAIQQLQELLAQTAPVASRAGSPTAPSKGAFITPLGFDVEGDEFFK